MHAACVTSQRTRALPPEPEQTRVLRPSFLEAPGRSGTDGGPGAV